MKKFILSFLNFIGLLSISLLFIPLDANAESTNDINELWGEKTKDFLGKDYSEYNNKKIIGKYYKVGIMGHHIVTNISKVTLNAYRMEDLIPSKSVGLASETKVTTTSTYTVINQIISSAKVKVGTCDEIKAVVNLEDIGNVGTNTSLTTEYTFAIEQTFAETLYKSLTVEDTLDYTTIPSDKKTFSVSRVACVLEFDIASTYTEEQNMFGKWNAINSTRVENFKIRYYIADVICYCYNDNTFGDTKMGVYPLKVIKEY